MKSLENISKRLKYESSIIFSLLLAAGVGVLWRDPKSMIGIALLIVAMLVALLGFIINSIRESYDSLITQKDEMIKTLTKERTKEIKHSESLRMKAESHASGGWVSSAPRNDT